MVNQARRAERRGEALTRESIVAAAIELLDLEGDAGLTFRALATKLSTGAGAIYWHVANKEELLLAATELVVSAALSNADDAGDTTPRETVRTIAVGVFDAIDAHPWLGTQLARAPSHSAMLSIFEGIGRAVQALDVPQAAQFTSAMTLVNYMLGVGSQNAANARMVDAAADRREFLSKTAAVWAALDADEYAFTRTMAAPLRDHDDRAEFLAGIDLILAGIARP